MCMSLKEKINLKMKIPNYNYMLCQIEYISSTIILCAKSNVTYCSNVCKKMLLLLMMKQTGIPSIFNKIKIYIWTRAIKSVRLAIAII